MIATILILKLDKLATASYSGLIDDMIYTSDIFKISPNFFHVVLYFNKNDTINDTINLSDIDIDVFKEISRDPHITMDAIAKSLGFSQKTIARSIKTLRDNNIIIRQGSKKTGHWKVNKI